MRSTFTLARCLVALQGALTLFLMVCKVAQGAEDRPSFPLMITRGPKTAELKWSDLPKAMAQGKMASRSIQVQGCPLAITTGPLQAGTLEPDSETYRNDSLAPRTELALDSDEKSSLYLRLSADLRVRLEPRSRSLCRSRLGGRRTLLGRMSLEGTRLIAQGSGNPMIHPVMPSAAEFGTLVYLDWPGHHALPHLSSGQGQAAVVTSWVYRVDAAASSARFFIDASPTLNHGQPDAAARTSALGNGPRPWTGDTNTPMKPVPYDYSSEWRPAH